MPSRFRNLAECTHLGARADDHHQDKGRSGHVARPRHHGTGSSFPGSRAYSARSDRNRYGARMRHLWSFLAGVVAAPLTWVLITLGQDGSTRTVTRWLEIGKYNTANLIEPSVYLAVAGILLGLVGTLRVSPLGPLTAGLALITPYLGLFVNPFWVRDTVPTNWEVFGDPLPLLLTVENGTLFFLGALLVIATFSAQRWRRWPAPGDGDPRRRRPRPTTPRRSPVPTGRRCSRTWSSGTPHHPPWATRTTRRPPPPRCPAAVRAKAPGQPRLAPPRSPTPQRSNHNGPPPLQDHRISTESVAIARRIATLSGKVAWVPGPKGGKDRDTMPATRTVTFG